MNNYGIFKFLFKDISKVKEKTRTRHLQVKPFTVWSHCFAKSTHSKGSHFMVSCSPSSSQTEHPLNSSSTSLSRDIKNMCRCSSFARCIPRCSIRFSRFPTPSSSVSSRFKRSRISSCFLSIRIFASRIFERRP